MGRASGALRPKRARYTSWVTAANINGSGMDVVSSANINLDLLPLPDLAGIPTVEVNYKHRKTTGDSVHTWIQFPNLQLELTATAHETQTTQNSKRIITTSTVLQQRKLRFKPDIMHSRDFAAAGVDAIRLIVQSAGATTPTEWEVTDIQARLIYVPL